MSHAVFSPRSSAWSAILTWPKKRSHEAIMAMEHWPGEGIPTNPRAWLVSTGRFKAIDRIRRRARFDTALDDVVERLQGEEFDPTQWVTSISKTTGCG